MRGGGSVGGPGVAEVSSPRTAGELGIVGQAEGGKAAARGPDGGTGAGTASDLHPSRPWAGHSDPHFRDEEVEAQRSRASRSESHSSKATAKTHPRSVPL